MDAGIDKVGGEEHDAAMPRLGLGALLLALTLTVAGSLRPPAAQSATYPPLKFTAPARLNMTIGEPFSYSLCNPAARPNGRCGGRGSINPSGGFGQYYTLSIKWILSGGNRSKLPPGIKLSSRTGVLSGTPTGPAGHSRFVVCAQDANTRRPGGQLKCASLISAEVVAPEDTTPPAVPTGLGASDGPGFVDLDWDDNTEEDLAGYLVYRDGVLIADTPTSDYRDTAEDWETHTYSVSAYDQNGNESDRSGEVEASTLLPNFSGTWLGTWSGNWYSNDGCAIPESGDVEIFMEEVEGGYAVTEIFYGLIVSWDGETCEIAATGDEAFDSFAAFSPGATISEGGELIGDNFSAPWDLSNGFGTLTGQASRTYPGGVEEYEYSASLQ